MRSDRHTFIVDTRESMASVKYHGTSEKKNRLWVVRRRTRSYKRTGWYVACIMAAYASSCEHSGNKLIIVKNESRKLLLDSDNGLSIHSHKASSEWLKSTWKGDSCHGMRRVYRQSTEVRGIHGKSKGCTPCEVHSWHAWMKSKRFSASVIYTLCHLLIIFARSYDHICSMSFTH